MELEKLGKVPGFYVTAKPPGTDLRLELLNGREPFCLVRSIQSGSKGIEILERSMTSVGLCFPLGYKATDIGGNNATLFFLRATSSLMSVGRRIPIPESVRYFELH